MIACFECGRGANHNHHVVPRLVGGTRTVPLCVECHAKVHDRKSMACGELIKEGQRRARSRGVRIGRPRLGDGPRAAATLARVLALRDQGRSVRAIGRALSEASLAGEHLAAWSPATIARELKKHE